MKPQKWSYFIYNPAIINVQDIEAEKAFQRIKERTDGLLDIKTVVATALPIKAQERLRAVSEGQIEMTIGESHHAGDLPLYLVTDIPYLVHNEGEQIELFYATRDMFQRELNKINVYMTQAYHVQGPWSMFTDEAVDLFDLKKKKIRGPTKQNAAVVEAMGGTPVTIAWGETYSALERGIANGVFTGTDSIINMKMHEVVPYWYGMYWIAIPHHIVINKEKWESLPEDIQLIVIEELDRQTVVCYAKLPTTWSDLIVLAEGTGLKEYNPGPPTDAWFDMINEKVTKVFVQQAIDELGPLAVEYFTIAEEVLGRSVMP